MFSSDPVKISKSALLPYTDEQLFGLVNDVESYPDFLEGCSRSEVILATENVVEAKLFLKKRGIEQSFTTRNSLSPNSRIVMELVEGPFSSLDGEWNIRPLGDQGCKLSLDLQFTLGTSLIMRMAAPHFADVANRLVDAVVAEAHRRFGAS